MNNSWSKFILGAGLAGGMLLAANGVSAEKLDLKPLDPDERAKADYVNYCASCHGVGGEGNGPMASTLKNPPTNLTILAKENGGTFPYLKLRKIIDGSYTEGKLRSHSSKEMPIWGDAFRREALDTNSHVAAQARIMNILDYISMIQY